LIDLHCHLLPAIDDGARNVDEAVKLAEVAYKSGITHVVCTPHIHDGYFDNTIENIEDAHNIFREALIQASIPLKSYFAAEVRISQSIIKLAETSRLPFLGYLYQKPVLLLELPHSHIPPGTEQLLSWLKANNILPMIAHPERNRDILANYNKAKWLRGKGVLFQITAGAITGTFGERVQNCAFKLLQDHFADIVATDTHNLHRRPPELAGAYQILVERHGKAAADDLCTNNPLEIAGCWFND